MTRASALNRLRKICMGLPEVTEQPFGGHTAPCFRVRGKIFVFTSEKWKDNPHSMTVKAPAGAQQVLVGSDPDRFFVPAYIGSKGWVGMRLDTPPPDWPLIEDLVKDSYRLIAPRRLSAAVP